MGDFIFTFGSIGSNNGEFIVPIAIAVNSNGQILVTDIQEKNVQVFDACGNYLFQFAGPGSNPENLSNPTGIAVDEDNQIFVIDNGGIKVYNSVGDFLYTFPSNSGIGITLDEQGNVIRSYFSNIREFDRCGEFLREFGTSGSLPGQLNLAAGLAISNDGILFVTDSNNHRIQVFK